MMREDELKRILSNLTLNGNPKSKDDLIDLKVMEKKEDLLQVIDEIGKMDNLHIEKNVDLKMDIIDEKELNRFEQILRDEINAIICVQKVFLKDDDWINQNIYNQQMILNFGYRLCNINDAITRFDRTFNGLFWKFRNWIFNNCGEKNCYNKAAIRDGDIWKLDLKELDKIYKSLLIQLNYLIRCYELDMVRKELVNIVKYIMMKIEMEDR